MIQRAEARRLSAKNEWSLISSSLPPELGALSADRLKSKIVRARKLRKKYQDLYQRQKLSSRSRMTGTPYERLNVRTRRKKQMFEEAIVRLRLQLGKVSAPGQTLAGVAQRRTAKAKPAKLHSLPAQQRNEKHRQSLRDRAVSPALPKAMKTKAAGYRRRQSHVLASGRRRQAKRDSIKRK